MPDTAEGEMGGGKSLGGWPACGVCEEPLGEKRGLEPVPALVYGCETLGFPGTGQRSEQRKSIPYIKPQE